MGRGGKSGKDPPVIKSTRLLSIGQRSKSTNVSSAIKTASKKRKGSPFKPTENQKNCKINNTQDSVSVTMSEEEEDDYQSVKSQTKDNSYSNKTQSTKDNSKTAKPKPICLTLGTERIPSLKDSIIKLELQSDFKIKASAGNQVQIFTNSKPDKHKIIEFLKTNSAKFQFHTFTEKDEKDLTYVLKNHYYMEPPDMLKMLQDNECPATSVKFLNSSKSNPSFTVHFPKGSVNLITLRTSFKVLDHCVVKWENFNNSKKKITQCHRCQRFGHTARNCNHDYRCVKCTDVHEPGKCSRTSRTEGNPKCINCGKEHAANNSKCEAFINYKEKLEKLKKPKFVHQTAPRKFVSTPAPWVNSSLDLESFPPLKNSVNYRLDRIQGEASQNMFDTNNLSQSNEFSNIQNEFSSIPDIAETLRLFREMTNKLKSTSCQKTRLSILIEYTTV